MIEKKLGDKYIAFKVHARLAQLLGQQLVSSPKTAVNELVKNSYDADATSVKVNFINIDSENGSIIIEDNGLGMDYSTIENNWMVIGTQDKERNPYTEYGCRRKVGAKGIGRFAVERLAQKCILTTKKRNCNEVIIVEIDWNKYEYNDNQSSFQDFTEVYHPVKIIQSDENWSGSKLELIGLRDVWNKKDIIELKKDLYLLLPISQELMDFSIQIYCNSYPEVSEELQRNMLNYCYCLIKGSIKENGKAEYYFDFKGENEKYDYIDEKRNYSTGPIDFECYIFILEGDKFKGLKVTLTEVKKALFEYGGIRVYRDKFRVKPYGDPGNDWLDLNLKRTRDPEQRVGTNNIFGSVYISRDINPGLEDLTGREGIPVNNEFIQMRDFVNKGFDIYTTRRREILNRKEVIPQSEKEALEEIKDETKNIFNDFKDKLKEESSKEEIFGTSIIGNNEHNSYTNLEQITNDAQKKIEQIIDEKKEIITIQRSRYDRSIQRYRNLATLGIAAAAFGHEVEGLIDKANTNMKSQIQIPLDKYFRLIDIEQKDELISEVTENTIFIQDKLNNLYSRADFFRGYLRREKRKLKNLDIYKIFKNVFESFKSAFDGIDATVTIELYNSDLPLFGPSYPLPLLKCFEVDIESIATNFITNAYHALKYGEEKDNRFLKITFEYDNNIIKITSKNNGTVIKPSERDLIFVPMFSTKLDGTGLGLTIIKETLDFYKGTICLLYNEFPITVFEMSIPIDINIIVDEEDIINNE